MDNEITDIIAIKRLQMTQISASNIPLGVDMPLNKLLVGWLCFTSYQTE